MKTDILRQLQLSNSAVAKRWVVVQALLDSMDDAMVEATIAAAIPHWFNSDILAALLETNRVDSEAVYANLRLLPVTESFGTLGHTLHDLTRSSIILYLRENKPGMLQTYSKKAYRFFNMGEGAQTGAEAVYHLLASKTPDALPVFKRQSLEFRSNFNYAAANSLIRNGEELAALGLVDDAFIAELERQKYLIAADVLRKVFSEKKAWRAGASFG